MYRLFSAHQHRHRKCLLQIESHIPLSEYLLGFLVGLPMLSAVRTLKQQRPDEAVFQSDRLARVWIKSYSKDIHIQVTRCCEFPNIRTSEFPSPSHVYLHLWHRVISVSSFLVSYYESFAKIFLLIRDTPHVSLYILNMFSLRESRL